MLLPVDYSRITPLVYDSYDELKGLSVVEFDEGNDGGGDGFYLYWPLGREQAEPFVCLFRHEEHILTVPYRRLADFLADFTTGESNLSDESFFYFSYAQAKLRFKKGQPEQTIEILLDCVSPFPDFSDAWSLLAAAYQMIDHYADAAVAVRKAILSAWQFGMPSAQCVTVFQSVTVPSHLAHDPLFKNREDLFQAGTHRQAFQLDYARLWSIAQRYIELEDIESAVRVTQNYGYALHRAPQSQRVALQFSTNQWEADLQALKQKLRA